MARVKGKGEGEGPRKNKRAMAIALQSVIAKDAQRSAAMIAIKWVLGMRLLSDAPEAFDSAVAELFEMATCGVKG